MPDGGVIAGGFSSRFAGGDEAVADLAGTPMLRRVADRLAGVVDPTSSIPEDKVASVRLSPLREQTEANRGQPRAED